jgi:hypothetical protein
MPFGLGENWVKAQGLVVASREIGSKGLGTWREEWVVEVHAPDGEVFRSPIKWPMVEHDDFSFIPCSVGDTVGIEYDPKNHNLRWDKSDRRINMLAKTPASEKARRDQGFNDALAGRIPSAPDPSLAGLDPELNELADLQTPTPAPGPSADGKVGLDFQFDASGRPAAGQVESVISSVNSGQMRTIRGKADQILATGTHGTAVITTASPMGKTVRDINPNADPSRLNDPMWLFTVEVSLAGQNPFPAVMGHRVPLAKLATIAPGVRLAVAVNPANPNNEVAIDWDKSPLS